MINLFIYICLINLIYCPFFNSSNKIIISLTSNLNSIEDTLIVINSILEQGINEKYYEVLLILSIYDFKDIFHLPEELQNLEKLKKIKIKFVKERISNKIRTLITMREYKHHPILIINNKCLLPEGWLNMFINDHFKYPEDAIAASIQYIFGQNNEITELSEGFKGEKFGTFNHVTEMIFNFALIDIDLGGILYPQNFFQNSSFYNQNYLDISEDFWETAFIIMEDKNLRQSSRIFDYTKYLINDINYNEFYKKKKMLLEKDKLLFLKTFPYFDDSIEKRKQKIIVSITSYPKRFVYLPDLMKFIRNQNFKINKIFFFLYKEDIKYLNLKISDFHIISTEMNLKPHLKYFYAMKLFRDHAIITLDDDVGYARDTFQSLFNAYIENPNLISGRRSHLMTYKKNGELKSYYRWKHQQKTINESNFNLTLTNVGGSIFPPDILNINNDFLPIINETLTCDDLTLKYFANIKGIPQKWIFNNRVIGIRRKLPKTKDSPLSKINFINNDICLNKLNILINTETLNNLCVPYKNISTGNTIYLFDIHNKTTKNNILYFEIYAYSHCPIDLKIKFKIIFDDNSASCNFQQLNPIISEKNESLKNNIVASCESNDFLENIDDYYFPSIESENNIIIKVFNFRKYLTIIFKNFFCIDEDNNCVLKVILYDGICYDKLRVMINNNHYFCNIKERNISKFDHPIIKDYKCKLLDYLENKNLTFISGIPKKIALKNQKDNNMIPNQFFISKYFVENIKRKGKVIIIGKLSHDLEGKFYRFYMNVFHPNFVLKCKLKPYSKNVNSKIFCINNKKITSDILIENQIVHLLNNDEQLLLINKETLIKVGFNRKIKKEKDYPFMNYKEEILFIHMNILLIVLFKIKDVFSGKYQRY